MRRSTFASPDPFSMAPLLTLLPVQGDINRLVALRTSLYARYEKVNSQLSAAEGDSGAQRSFAAEEAMLKQVLDWCAQMPEGEA